MGQKGGGKGWCGDCLRAEEHEKLGIFRDEHYDLYFSCRSCDQAVRVRKEGKKKWMQGSEHLFERRLCQVCFDLN